MKFCLGTAKFAAARTTGLALVALAFPAAALAAQQHTDAITGSRHSAISVAAAPSPKMVRNERSVASMYFEYVSAVINSTRRAEPARIRPSASDSP